jgi:uncharacterized membrane protein YoaK (UPF0700 family)
MISILPRWVWTGAWVLAFIAGIVNVVGYLGFQHQAITHLTGNTSLLAEALVARDVPQAKFLVTLLGSFVAGCVVSGFIIQDSTLKLGHRYGVALLLVSALLFSSISLLELGSLYGMYVAAGACGLQNAMISTYSGAVIRTTHISGMFTDLGIALGHALRGMPVDQRRLLLCGLVISGFFCGGVVGALLFNRIHYLALLVPAILTAVVAVAYGLYSFYRRRFRGW